MTISGKNYFSYDFPIDKTGKMFIIYNCSDTVGEIMNCGFRENKGYFSGQREPGGIAAAVEADSSAAD